MSANNEDNPIGKVVSANVVSQNEPKTNKNLPKLNIHSNQAQSPGPTNQTNSGPQIIQTTGPNGQTQFIMIQQSSNEDNNNGNLNQPGGSQQNNQQGGQDLVDLLRNASNPDGSGPQGGPGGPGGMQGNPNGGLRVVQTPQGQIVIPNGQSVPGGGAYTPTIVQQTPMGTRQIMIQQPDDGQGGGPGHNTMDQNQFVQIVTPNGQPIGGPQYGQQPAQIIMTPQGQMLMTQPQQQPQQKIIVVKTEDGEQQYIIQEPAPQPQYVIKQSQQPYVVMNQGGQGNQFVTSSAPVINQNSSNSRQKPGTSPGAGSGKRKGGSGSNIPNKKQHQRESSGMSILSEVASRELGGNQNSSPAPRKQVKKSRNTNQNSQMNQNQNQNVQNVQNGNSNNSMPIQNVGPPSHPNSGPQFMINDNHQSGPPPGTGPPPPPSGASSSVHNSTQLPQLTNRHPSGDSNDIKPYIDEFGQVRIPGTKSTVEKNKDKRERNKLAARRCRQRKMDKIKTLEETVSRMNGVLTNLRHTLTNVKRFATDNGLKELQNIISGIDLNDKMLQPFDLRRLDEELMSDRHMDELDDNFTSPRLNPNNFFGTPDSDCEQPKYEVKQEPMPLQPHFHQSNLTEQVRLNMQQTANRQMQLANQEQKQGQMVTHETHIINGQPFVTAVTTSMNNSGLQHHEIMQPQQMQQVAPQQIRVQNSNNQQMSNQVQNGQHSGVQILQQSQGVPHHMGPKIGQGQQQQVINLQMNSDQPQTPRQQVSVKTESITPEKANNSELPSSEAERETSMLDKALADSQKSPEMSMNEIEGLITATNEEGDSRNQSLDKILEETSSEPVKPELMEAALEASLEEEPVEEIKSPEEVVALPEITDKPDLVSGDAKNYESPENKKKTNSTGENSNAADITKELANATQKSKPVEK